MLLYVLIGNVNISHGSNRLFGSTQSTGDTNHVLQPQNHDLNKRRSQSTTKYPRCTNERVVQRNELSLSILRIRIGLKQRRNSLVLLGRSRGTW